MPIAAPVKPTGGAIAVSIAVAFGLAGACTQFLTLNMPFGGALPGTMTNPEWAEATKKRMQSWEREGAPDRPVKMNPIFGDSRS